MNCETCKKETVCKFKDWYIKSKNVDKCDEFKGIFNIACNEYVECNDSHKSTTEGFIFKGCKVGDFVRVNTKLGIFKAKISGLDRGMMLLEGDYYVPVYDINDIEKINGYK